MSRVAYVNGRYVPHRLASVHVEDRGYQFADGVYEVLHVHVGQPVDRDRHLDRLDRSLRELRIEAPIGRAALLVVIDELVRRNHLLRDGLVYLQVTRGAARREHVFPPAGTRPSLVVTARRLPPFPRDLSAWTASAITLPDQRWARCDIKSVALLPNVLARQAARDRGATEAILVDADGMVTEGAATSVWMVDAQGILRTRKLSHAILPGCTRAALMQHLAAADITVEEHAFSVQDLRVARELFLTSATSFVKPVLTLDGAPIGQGQIGPITTRLFHIFTDHLTRPVQKATVRR